MLDWLLQGDYGSAPTNWPAVLLSLLLAFACGHVIAWVYMWTHSGLSYSKSFVNSLVVMPMIVALVIFFVGAFRKLPKAGTVLSYSLVEGVFLGGISMFYQDFVAASGSDANIIIQAVIGTFVAFGVMLALYRTRIIKVNGTFMKIMMVAMVSYLVIALISFVAALFGVGGGWGFYGVGGLGLLLCVAGVALAAFSLNLDFAAIEEGINEGLPEAYSWRMAFGLVVTMVWLYLEILRFLAILNSNN